MSSNKLEVLVLSFSKDLLFLFPKAAKAKVIPVDNGTIVWNKITLIIEAGQLSAFWTISNFQFSLQCFLQSVSYLNNIINDCW